MTTSLVPNYVRTMGRKMLTVEVSIPAAASAAVTILSLVSAALGSNRAVGCKVEGLVAAGTDRGAIVFGDATGNLKGHRAAGSELDEPFVDLSSVFVRAASGAAVPATILVYTE